MNTRPRAKRGDFDQFDAASILLRTELDPQRGCWLWQGRPKSKLGYGKTRKKYRTIAPHRLIYLVVIGPVPNGHELDHTCGVRHCCNVDHLEPVTHTENVRRGKLWKPVCPRCGGAWKRHGGEKVCLPCERAYRQRWRQANLERERARSREWMRKKRAKAHDAK